MVNSDEEKGSDESKADDKDKIGLDEHGWGENEVGQ